MNSNIFIISSILSDPKQSHRYGSKHEESPASQLRVDFLYLYCAVTRKADRKDDFLNTVSALEKSFPSPSLFIMKGEYLQENGYWQEAQNAYQIANDMVPSKQTARGKLALLYNEIGRKEEAIVIARQILTESVKVYGFDTFELHQKLKDVFGDLSK